LFELLYSKDTFICIYLQIISVNSLLMTC